MNSLLKSLESNNKEESEQMEKFRDENPEIATNLFSGRTSILQPGIRRTRRLIVLKSYVARKRYPQLDDFQSTGALEE